MAVNCKLNKKTYSIKFFFPFLGKNILRFQLYSKKIVHSNGLHNIMSKIHLSILYKNVHICWNIMKITANTNLWMSFTSYNQVKTIQTVLESLSLSRSSQSFVRLAEKEHLWNRLRTPISAEMEVNGVIWSVEAVELEGFSCGTRRSLCESPSRVPKIWRIIQTHLTCISIPFALGGQCWWGIQFECLTKHWFVTSVNINLIIFKKRRGIKVFKLVRFTANRSEWNQRLS